MYIGTCNIPYKQTAILLALILLVCSGCSKKVETTETGPGGLPKGTFETGSFDYEDESSWPIFEGATRQPNGSYLSDAPLADVTEFYTDELGVSWSPAPDIDGGRMFETETLTVILLPGVESGTEIRFLEPES